MIAQIYVKSNDDYTSMLVCNDKGIIYFQDVLDVPEITGIQRCVSFVKHHVNFDKTEIYPDKLDNKVLDDAYIRYCKVKPEMGKNPIKKAQDECAKNLAIHLRWDNGEKECAVMNTIFNGRD